MGKKGGFERDKRLHFDVNYVEKETLLESPGKAKRSARTASRLGEGRLTREGLMGTAVNTKLSLPAGNLRLGFPTGAAQDMVLDMLRLYIPQL